MASCSDSSYSYTDDESNESTPDTPSRVKHSFVNDGTVALLARQVHSLTIGDDAAAEDDDVDPMEVIRDVPAHGQNGSA